MLQSPKGIIERHSPREVAEYARLLARHPRTAEPPHYVLYTNSPGPFKRAMESIRDYWQRTIVIDNRALFDEAPPPRELVHGEFAVYKPDCALYIAQALTMLITKTHEMGFEWFTWMHDDCVMPPGVQATFYERLAEIDGKDPNWSVIFTTTVQGQSDVFCAYHIGPCLAVQGYDWLSFPSYHADAHFYGRLKKAGFDQYQTMLYVEHSKNNDRTLNTSELRFRAHCAYDEASRKLWYEIREKEKLPG